MSAAAGDGPSLGGVEHQRVEANGLNFHVATAGPATGPLVMMLHGFPEFWYGWRHQMGALADAGFRVAAPDQRGYGQSDKPRGVPSYGLDTLADDVIALAAALGHAEFTVVGHDWGGMVAWHLAGRNPEEVKQTVILNAPHPATFSSYAFTHPLQFLRSMYVGFFQVPWLPETALRANGCAALKMALTGTSNPGTFTEAELVHYQEAWERAGALTAMLNWYRAMPLERLERARIATPLQVIWGDSDTALGKGMAEAGAAWCDQSQVVHLKGATHWLHHERASTVNALLTEFLTH